MTVKYLLDTNTIIRYLNGRAPNIRIKMRSIPFRDLGISSVVFAELRYGAAKAKAPIQTRAKQDAVLRQLTLMPFDEAAADVYGTIRADLESKGTPVGPNDLLIAATALAHQLILVTHNTREFQRIVGLMLEDWE